MGIIDCNDRLVGVSRHLRLRLGVPMFVARVLFLMLFGVPNSTAGGGSGLSAGPYACSIIIK